LDWPRRWLHYLEPARDPPLSYAHLLAGVGK
jgi:hypothetical protein